MIDFNEITIAHQSEENKLAMDIFLKLDNDPERVKEFASLLIEYAEATIEYREWR